jgi:hypothetical protein
MPPHAHSKKWIDVAKSLHLFRLIPINFFTSASPGLIIWNPDTMACMAELHCR